MIQETCWTRLFGVNISLSLPYKVSEHDPHELKHVWMAELAHGASRKVESVCADEPCHEDRDRCWRHAAREGRASKVKKVAEAEPRGSRVADHLWRVGGDDGRGGEGSEWMVVIEVVEVSEEKEERTQG